mgnify:FL=1
MKTLKQIKIMDKSDIKSKEKENNIGNLVLLFNFLGVLIFMIFGLIKSFNTKPITEWYFYFNIIGYSWGLIFISIFIFFTIRNLIK